MVSKGNLKENHLFSGGNKNFRLAGEQGFEPRFHDPESCVPVDLSQFVTIGEAPERKQVTDHVFADSDGFLFRDNWGLSPIIPQLFRACFRNLNGLFYDF
jgi:hypothetical protein